jgi:hypothetical protein
MASSFRYNPFRLPNFAVDGAVPEYLRRPRWLPKDLPMLPGSPPGSSPMPPLPPSPPGPSPFPDPLPPPSQMRHHDVDPPEQNPYNDPDYNIIVTENRSRRAGVEPAGGLLGLLQTAMRQSELQPDAGFEPSPQDAPAQAAAIQSTQPVRRLVRMRADGDSRPLSPASLPRVDLANNEAIARLLSGEPMQHWMMPIFDTRR